MSLENFNKYDAICLDCFDTLIIRNVDPEYLKLMWCGVLKKKYSINISVDDLYFLRNRIEGQHCGDNYSLYGAGEFQYVKMIFDFYNALLSINAMEFIEYDSFLKNVTEIEFEIEHPTMTPNTKLLDVLEKVEKPLYVVSDFYHDKEFILRLLEKIGVKLVFKKLFISSEYYKTKRDGNLYDHVLSELNFSDPSKILMVGDNKNSDSIMAESRKLKSLHLPVDEHRKTLWDESSRVSRESFLLEEIENILYDGSNDLFNELPLTMYLYIEKVILQAKMDGVKTLLCLAREGKVIQKMLDIYIEKNDIQGLSTKYFYTSRAASLLPSLKSLEEESFRTIARQYPHISIKSFLYTLAFPESLAEEIAVDIGIDYEKRISSFFLSEYFLKVKEHPKFKSEYEKNRQEQNQIFNEYINQFISDEEVVGLVDVGWKGTIQDHIYKALGEKRVVKGYYIGIDQLTGVLRNNSKNGLVFSMFPVQTDSYNVYRMNKPLFETLLSANHGSTQAYERNDKEVTPVLNHIEKEEEIYNTFIKEYQDFLIETFIKLTDFFLTTPWSSLDIEKNVHELHARMILSPRVKEMKYFSNIKHFENFGDITFSTFAASWSPKEFYYFLRSPKQYLRGSWWMTLRVYQILGRLGVFAFSIVAKPHFTKTRSRLNRIS